MGRLKRSCVVGSVVFHALTLALLVIAPVLLAKRVEKVQVIDLIPSEIVDQIMAPPAPVAPPTQPTPAPTKPTPPKPKPVKPKPKPVEVVKPKPKPKPVKPKINVNLKSTLRQPDTQKVKAQQAAAERARQAEAKRQAALKQSLNKLDSKLSGRTSVNVPQGRYAAANYESLIRRKYVDATIHPGTISGDPVVKVQLVIARNGNVISARIIGVSGLAIWDRAVQKALDRVKRIAPFPAGMSGAKKTFNLNFNSRSFQ
jgi:protein TonB